MSRIAKAAAVALGTGAVVLSGTGLAMADAGAEGAAVGSGGVLSGNVIQAPVDTQINFCGNTLGAGLLNPAFGQVCVNDGGRHEEHKDHKDHKEHKEHKDGRNGYGG
ncbi:chaplin [Streptomyces sp. NPDC000987]|uniref:chaplin n=1 Tax=Streptomyces sp. NPDC000987 TaxID=3154374 RepID=UPI00332C9DEA